MASVVMPEARIPYREGDERLPGRHLKNISFFKGLKKLPNFDKNPGSTVLRRFRRGDTVVRQGDAGWTAFYILTTEDLLELRRAQLAEISTAIDIRRTARINLEWRERLTRQTSKLREEIASLESRQRELGADVPGQRTAVRHVASARLSVDLAPGSRRAGLFRRLRATLRGTSSAPAPVERPQYIRNDGPQDINLRTRQAAMYEGELFGEMSCLSRSPRSATIVAEQDCYMLEVLKTVLEQMGRDTAFRERMEKQYRELALGPQLRALPFFAALTPGQFDWIQEQVELVTYPPGGVIIDEHDQPDALYVIRGGMVKITKGLHYLLTEDDIQRDGWSKFCHELADAADNGGLLLAAAWKLLSGAVQTLIREMAAGPFPDHDSAQAGNARKQILSGLNNLVRDRRLVQELGKKKSDWPPEAHALRDHEAVFALPEKFEEWTDLDVREFNRLVLEEMAPQSIPERRLQAGHRRTLVYMGKGDYFGEAGVVQGEPRSATCVAYNHPDNGQSVGGGIVASKVELIRIRAQDLEELCMASPRLREALDKVLRDRRLEHDTRVAVRPYDEKQPIRFHPAFEELGLIQGQKLMLIDLDRCTRCGDCVRACVSAHDDGASRLFLDGPRFGKFLVPDTCRKCRDPVCMIGCPVGSIVRGDDGEIVIKDWCIGCRACADQCPYGAIQMNQLADLDVPHSGPGPLDLEPQVVKQGEVEVKTVSLRAVVCDLCVSTPSKDPACVYHCPHDAAFRLDAGFDPIDRFGPAS